VNDRLDPATRAVRTTIVAIIVAGGGAVLAATATVLDAGNTWIGGGYAAAFGGLGWALVVWSHRLLAGEEVSEPRTPLDDPEAARAAAAVLDAGERPIRRRRLLGGLFSGAAGLTGLAILAPLTGIGPGRTDVLRRTPWGEPRGQRLVDADGAPIAVDDLAVGEVLTVFPEQAPDAADAQTVLVRLGDDVRLEPPGRSEWTAAGYVAYSQLCTHAGCPVGLYEATDRTLLCPCHQSAFDVTAGARPTMGPAARPLPQLPLGLDAGGYLIALGDFPSAVGPGWWTRP
jgi:ubiquinol-cytochrome c reductase iron-sulfur subunit